MLKCDSLAPGARVRCPGCKRVVTVPGAKHAEEEPAQRSKWPLLAALAGALLLAGGGVTAWLMTRPKPAPENVASGDPNKGTPSAGGESAPFTLTASLDRPEASPGTQTKLTVRARRAEGFTGEIPLLLDGLPDGVTTGLQNIPENQNEAVLRLDVAATAKLGRYPLRATGRTKFATKDLAADAPSCDLVLVAPFVLKVDPTLMVPQGGKAPLLVTAERQGGYDGPIALAWTGLPTGVTTAPVQVATGQKTAICDVSAAADAPLGNRPDVTVTGTANQQTASGKLSIQVTAATTVKPPFDLTLDPNLLKLAQGGKAVLKATVVRREYAGAINIELRNLPAKVDAQKAVIPPGANTVNLELTAAADAVPGARPDVFAVGTTTDPMTPQVLSGKITLLVTELTLFSLQIDPIRPKVSQGGKTQLTVTANRTDYQGPIDVELRNLPAGVTAAKALMPQGQNQVRVELTALGTATAGDRPDVTVVGIAIQANRTQVVSNPFTLQVAATSTADLLEIRISPVPLRVPQGGKTRLEITVVRKGYQGPVAVDLRNLPAGVDATKAMIAQGQNAIGLEVTARPEAVPGDRPDVVVLATATDAGNRVVESPRFLLSVTAAGAFTLVVDAPPLKLKPGGKTLARVVATRMGYAGPINVEFRNLPPMVTASRGTILQGKDTVDIELVADIKANKGDTPTVVAVGTATVPGAKEVLSGPVVVSIGAAPSFELKIDSASVTVRQGGTVKVRVSAVRKDYDGPIDVELKGLPGSVTAQKALIAKGQNSVDIDLAAQPKATLGDKTDVHAVGAALSAGIKDVVSGNVTVSVKSAPSFDLTVAANVTIHQGGKHALKGTIVRKDYDGPITVGVVGLPAGVSGGTVTIPQGKNTWEIELVAAAQAPVGDKGDVHVHGIAGQIQSDSAAFKVSVQKKK
jgi:hypothetical protein